MKREAVRLTVVVVPNAKRSEVAGEVEGAIRIRLQAQPIEGRANQELVRMLARLLGVNKSAVQVVQGLTGRKKMVEVQGLSDAESVRKTLLDTAGQ